MLLGQPDSSCRRFEVGCWFLCWRERRAYDESFVGGTLAFRSPYGRGPRYPRPGTGVPGTPPSRDPIGRRDRQVAAGGAWGVSDVPLRLSRGVLQQRLLAPRGVLGDGQSVLDRTGAGQQFRWRCLILRVARGYPRPVVRRGTLAIRSPLRARPSTLLATGPVSLGPIQAESPPGRPLPSVAAGRSWGVSDVL